MLAHEVRRGFATKICILASGKSYDVHGAAIMKNIKQASKEPVEFIGVGGDLMKEEGLEKSLINIEEFTDKPFYPYKNFFPKYLESFIHPPTLPVKINTYKVMKKLNKENAFREIYEAQPDLFLTLGNDWFMSHFYSNFKEIYSERDLIKPPMTFYDSLIINQIRVSQKYLDHVFYTTPKDAVNWRYYTFPSTYVGKFGAARALAHLYKNSSQHKHLFKEKEHTLLVSELFNQQLVEQLLKEESQRFRTANDLTDTTTVIFTMPGNTSFELKKSLPLILGSIKVFLKRFSSEGHNVAAENFALVITVDQQNAKEIESFVNSNKWPCKVILTRNDDEKYSAMAGSDFGLAVNGDAVAECAVMQLPTIIVDPSNFFNTYFKLLYNNFSNDINIARNGEIYPELHHTQAHPGKVLQIWSEWFTKPRLRFKYIQNLEGFITKLTPAVATQLPEVKPKEVVEGDVTYKERYFGEYLMAKKLVDAAEAFKEVKSKPYKRFELGDARREMMEKIGPGFAYLSTDYET